MKPIDKLRKGKAGRISSWDRSGCNRDSVRIPPGERLVLGEIEGPARITHLWMTQRGHLRETLLAFTWDDAPQPSVLCPVGDFFCLGHELVNSFQNALFCASTHFPYEFNQKCAFNCYAPMPFKKRARVELINESSEMHGLFFALDYETMPGWEADDCYFHAEFRRTNPFSGWAPEITVDGPGYELGHVPNKELDAWNHNYVILDTKGRGHYIGCNLSVTNLRGEWWGEGDEMIWVDGYKWPPDLHGTGTEDYLNHAWGMQENAFWRNGTSIYEGRTVRRVGHEPWREGGYSTAYVLHLENPVPFDKEIKVTIEHGHGNFLGNEMASVAYWYASEPAAAIEPPPARKRRALRRIEQGGWIDDPEGRCPGPAIPLDAERRRRKEAWAALQQQNKK